jgi:hypothetical protein
MATAFADLNSEYMFGVEEKMKGKLVIDRHMHYTFQ